ncbi:MAG: electron transporter RnfE [Oscillospiraceae bacterium]|nr:electron transporter RnfE [Oscillospiraceae bacterium]
MDMGKQIKEGLLTRNPAAVQLLGLCAALAVTTTLRGGLGMGLCALMVLTLSNGILSLLREYIPKQIRLLTTVAVVATLGAVADLVIQAFLPGLMEELGLFLPLLGVICVLLGQGGAFAWENSAGSSLIEGLCQGVGYTLVLSLVGLFRELLGKGSFGSGMLNGGRGLQVFDPQYAAGGMVLPVGGFLVLAFVIALIRVAADRAGRPRKRKGAAKG